MYFFLIASIFIVADFIVADFIMGFFIIVNNDISLVNHSN